MLEPDKKPEARRHRFISRQRLGVAAAAMTLAAAALAPASATAGSLLSGYGGPGEGNQAILGSALLGGPSGGGGGGAESGSSATAQGSRGASAGEAATGSSGGKRAGGGASDGRRHSGGSASASGTGSVAPVLASAAGKSPGNIDVSNTGVISTADLAYILLAFAALAVTGVLTRLLARHPRQTTQGR